MSKIEITDNGTEEVHIRLKGSFADEDNRELKQSIEKLIAERKGTKQCIVDVTGLTYLNSNGLGTLIYEYMHMKEVGIATLFISGTDPDAFINKLFNETHLNRVFTYITTRGIPKTTAGNANSP